jgi:hypothetical protein
LPAPKCVSCIYQRKRGPATPFFHSIQRAHCKRRPEEFAAHVRGIPGYDTAQTGTISNVSDVIG